MQISAIIPTFNRKKVLPRAINSVLNQSVLVDEIIVVDDGSADNTKEYIEKEFPQVKYVYQSNQGVSSARNVGIRISSNDWIALLDSDDEWFPDKIKHQIEMLNKTDLKVCHTNEVWIRNGLQINQKKKHIKAGGWVFKKCLPLCAMSPSSILLHKSIFDAAGFFDENLPACEDYDLWLQVAARFEVAYVDTPQLKKYGGHDDQLSRKYWGMDRFRITALEKILLQNILDEDNQRAALYMLHEKLRILKLGARKHRNEKVLNLCEQKLLQWNVDNG